LSTRISVRAGFPLGPGGSRFSLRPRRSGRPRAPSCACRSGQAGRPGGADFTLNTPQAFGTGRTRRPGGACRSVAAGRAGHAGRACRPLRTGGAGGAFHAGGACHTGDAFHARGAYRAGRAGGADFTLNTPEAFGPGRARRPARTTGSGVAGTAFRSGATGTTWRASWSLGTGSTGLTRGPYRTGLTPGTGLTGGSLLPSWASMMRVTHRRWPMATARRSHEAAGQPDRATRRRRVQRTGRRGDRGRAQQSGRTYQGEQDAPMSPNAHAATSFLDLGAGSVPGLESTGWTRMTAGCRLGQPGETGISGRTAVSGVSTAGVYD
jgi:hypothetical protein